MSRTNPFKKKRRVANRTLLVYGEGMCEEMFLRHIKGLYSYNTNIAVTIRKGKGGTAVDVVIDADKVPGDFEKRVVVLDNDKKAEEMHQARKEAKNRGMILIENTPCIEALLLSILESSIEFSTKTSLWCKKEFESKYVDKKKRGDKEEYDKYFSKKVLDSRRLDIRELNAIILLLEGKLK
jgi:hypothetical protein